MAIAGFPIFELPDGTRVEKPHPEWIEHHVKWRWMLDSYEGGDAYRYNVYGMDQYQQQKRNLYRHKKEQPLPNEAGTYQQVDDDDYLMRLERTPVPAFVQEAVDKHLGKIYNQEIEREGPDDLVAWWDDVDGSGTSIDQWMSQSVAVLLMTLGQVDLLFDRPTIPAGETPKSLADDKRLGLDRCVASYILPENMVWWRLDRRGRYERAIVREVGEDGATSFVYWDATTWQRYDKDGKKVGDPGEHKVGRVPIIRCGDSIKRFRCKNVWMPRYETVAELQREFYNRDSEMVLADSTQAHPTPQCPEDYCLPNSTVPIGPGRILPMKKYQDGSGTSYQKWEYLEPPKGPAESLRLNLADLRDRFDRVASFTKPAGASGSTGSTVAQSGVSKRIDQGEGNELLGEIAGVLKACEEAAAEMAHLVQTGKEAVEGDIKIEYPKQFDLWTADELAAAIERFQGVLNASGSLPETEEHLLCKLVKLMLPGLEDSEYEEMDAEIQMFVASKSAAMGQASESNSPAIGSNESPGAADVPSVAAMQDDETQE